jgi:dienelactone hydrolase
MIVVHGGGWRGPDPVAMTGMSSHADRYRDRGWATLTTTHRSGGPSALADLQQIFEYVREQRPGLKVCTMGGSSGGHLALLLAASKPELACVISMAGPTNLDAIRGTPAMDALRRDHIVPAFGPGPYGPGAGFYGWNPVTYAAVTKARTLLLHAAEDPLVQSWQAWDYHNRRPSTVRAMVLEAGDRLVDFAHARVSGRAWWQAMVAERDLMLSVAP